ncbi:MAG: HEAT repeat domain-containing protein, partial [Deltaproteobacteria bacterium]|nr:HEAT repeat domain-containing protein [Deltaproteobacteria bacterium]
MPVFAAADPAPAAVPAVPETLSEECVTCGDVALDLVRLASPDPAVREAAVAALAAGPPLLVTAALGRVARADPVPAVRAAALAALGKVGEVRALTLVLEACRDPFLSVRLAAIEALGGLPLPPSRERLSAIAADAEQPLPARLAALQALSAHHTLEAHAAIQALAASVEEGATEAWRVAVEAAARAPAPCAACLEMRRTQVLLDLFATSAAKRQSAAAELGQLPIPLAAKLQLLGHAVADEDQTSRANAAQSLLTVARSAPEALPLLVRLATTSSEPPLVKLATEALLADPRSEASVALRAAALDPAGAVALRAAELLALRDDDAATAVLAEAVGHPEPEVARRALRDIGERRLAPEVRRRALALALAHRSSAVVREGARLIRPEDGADPELGAIGIERRGELPSAVQIELLVGRPEPEAIAAVVELLRDNGSDVARRILDTVSARKTKATLPFLVPVLAAALAFPDPGVSNQSLKILGQPPRPEDDAVAEMLAAAIEATTSPAVARQLYHYLRLWRPRGLDALTTRFLGNRRLPSSLRVDAAREVANDGAPGWVEALAPYRDDDAPAVRRAIAVLLAESGGTETPVAGVPTLEATQARELPGGAAESLGTSGAGDIGRDADRSAGEVAAGRVAAAAPLLSEAEEALPVEPTVPDLPWNGRWPLVLSMAGMGAVAFGTVANIAAMRPGGQFAAYALGTVIGGATPFLLTLNHDLTMGEATYITSHTGWAAAAGLHAAQLLHLEAATELHGANRSVGILAGLAGAGLSAWRAGSADWTGHDALLANFTAIQAGLAAKTIGMLVDSGNEDHDAAQLDNLAVVVAWGVGLMPATWFNRDLTLTGNDAYLLTFSSGLGAWLFGWGGHAAGRELLSSEGQRLAVGVLAGQSLGFLAGEVLSANLEVEPLTTGKLVLQAGLGAALGFGLARAVPREKPTARTLALAVDAGTTVGLIGAIALPQMRELAVGKRDMLLLGTLYGGVAGALLPLAQPTFAYQTGSRRLVGGALAGGSLGLLLGSALAPAVDPAPRTLAAGVGLTVWSSLLGLGSGLLSCDLAPDPRRCPTRAGLTLFAELGGAAGVLGAGLVADRLPTSGSAASNGLAGAGFGAWNGYLLTRLDRDAPNRVVLGGAMVLSSLAGGAGYLAAEGLGLGPGALWLGLAGTLVGNAWGAGLGYVLPESSTRKKLGLTLLAPLGLAATGGSAAWLLHERLELHAPAAALGLALGAWHTALLPYTWRPDTGARSRRVAGGAVVGGVTGAALALGLSPWLGDAELTQTALAAVLGNALGAGFGLDRDRPLTLSMQVAGTAGMVVGAASAPWTSFSGADAWWLGAGVLVGGWNGALLSGGLQAQPQRLSFASSGRKASGGLLLGGAAGGLVVAGAAQAMPPFAAADVAEIVLTSGVGNATGLGLGLVAGRRDLRPWVVGPGLGLAVLSSVWAPKTSYDGNAALWMGGAAGLGLWHGLLAYGEPT